MGPSLSKSNIHSLIESLADILTRFRKGRNDQLYFTDTHIQLLNKHIERTNLKCTIINIFKFLIYAKHIYYIQYLMLTTYNVVIATITIL